MKLASLASLTVIGWLLASFAVAEGQNHTCQGGHNCNDSGGTVTTSVDFVQETTQNTTLGDQIVAVTVENVLPDHSGAQTTGSPVEVRTGEVSVQTGDVSPSFVAGDTILNQSTRYQEAARTAVAGYGNTTASCFRTFGLGGSTREASWSLGLPLKDGDCALGEDAALAFMMGNSLAAWRMYCSQSNVQKVYGYSRWAKDRISRAEAVDGCLIEAGLAQQIAEVNEFREDFAARFGSVEALLETHAREIASWKVRTVELEATAERELEAIRAVAARPRVVYETVAAEVAPPPEACPPLEWPAGVNAVVCDGAGYLNPGRAIPPDPGSAESE